MTVVAEVRRVEDDGAVEDRRDPLHAPFSGSVPQLQVPAPLLCPILIQVDEQVQPAIEIQALVEVEIGMDTEGAARSNLVKSAATQVGIRNEAWNPRQRLEERHERRGVELGEYHSRRATEMLEVFGRVLTLGVALGDVPRRAIHRIELDENIPEQLRIEHVVQDDVRK